MHLFLTAKKNALGFAAVLLVFAVYGLTLAPSVVEIDSGELAAVQSRLGIAHPTGYPLFTVLGNVFLKLPLFHSVILQLNVLAALWCILGLFFFVRTTETILVQGRRPESGASHGLGPVVSASAAGLFLAFSRTYWTQGTSIEVYSLHVFLIVLVLFFAVRCLFEEKPPARNWIALAFCLGLSFTNHMSTLFLAPGLFLVWVMRVGFKRPGVSLLLLCALVFVGTICAVYLYLPVRAAENPALNWGNPSNWENLVRHVTGRQYSIWLFKSTEAAWKNFDRFQGNFPSEFSLFGLALGCVGFIASFLKSRRIFLFLTVCFAVTVLYAVNYDITDLDTYFLLAYIIFAFWIAFGINALWSFFIKKSHALKIAAVLLLALTLGFEMKTNWDRTDRSDYFTFEDYPKKALNSLPENAVLITYQWDYLVSPACYFQLVEGVRKDVAVIDKELLRRSWYFRQLETNHPEIMERIKPETEAFLEALRPFETGGTYNPQLLDRLYARLIQRLMETNLGQKSVFIGPELVDKELPSGEVVLPSNCAMVPDLFFYRVVQNTDPYIPLKTRDNAIRFPQNGNAYTENVKRYIARMAALRMLYETQKGHAQTAVELKQSASVHYPEFPFPATP